MCYRGGLANGICGDARGDESLMRQEGRRTTDGRSSEIMIGKDQGLDADSELPG